MSLLYTQDNRTQKQNYFWFWFYYKHEKWKNHIIQQFNIKTKKFNELINLYNFNTHKQIKIK